MARPYDVSCEAPVTLRRKDFTGTPTSQTKSMGHYVLAAETGGMVVVLHRTNSFTESSTYCFFIFFAAFSYSDVLICNTENLFIASRIPLDYVNLYKLYYYSFLILFMGYLRSVCLHLNYITFNIIRAEEVNL